ncbi:hypothetical protein [Kineococcus aurantiacus]|uniref:Uncharacterized protein n=1 Tax=Kineococcus aurantiacus TaxID=37633 RepID=A0A7Y9DPY5_9ACTN|nr:hypothetical protein [Kineococcus aurantiacus]
MVESAAALAYEAAVVHSAVDGATCEAASASSTVTDFPDAPDALVLVRNEDVLAVLDIRLCVVAIWWVEVLDFPADLERAAQDQGLGPGLVPLVHGTVFTHLAADSQAQQYLSSRGCTFARLEADAGPTVLNQQVFDLVSQQEVKHLSATQWVR